MKVAVSVHTNMIIHPQFSEKVPEMRLVSPTDIVPNLLSKLMRFIKRNRESWFDVAKGCVVDDQLKLIDYKGAERRNNWKSASCLRDGEGFDNRNFVS
jgi:hypothetical protein